MRARVILFDKGDPDHDMFCCGAVTSNALTSFTMTAPRMWPLAFMI